MQRPWYDRKDGIAKSLGSLEDLNKLIIARIQAHEEWEKWWSDLYDELTKKGIPFEEKQQIRKEEKKKNPELSKFVIKGTLYSNEGGGCCNLEAEDHGERSNELLQKVAIIAPPVLTDKEFWKFLFQKFPGANRGNYRDTVSFSFSSGEHPLPNIKCQVCDNLWNIDNIWNVMSQREFYTVPMRDFVGKTIGDLKARLTEIIGAAYDWPGAHGIKNPNIPDTMIIDPTKSDEHLVVPGQIYWHRTCWGNLHKFRKAREKKFKKQFGISTDFMHPNELIYLTAIGDSEEEEE